MTGLSGDADEATESEWNAYSDYQTVSQWVAESINEATHSYVKLSSAIRSGYKISPEEETHLRADILLGAMAVRTELEHNRQQREIYDEILSRWEGEDGFVTRFRELQLPKEYEPWIEQFIEDIRRAGWELGYLKAGREDEVTENGDGFDGELRDMIDQI